MPENFEPIKVDIPTDNKTNLPDKGKMGKFNIDMSLKSLGNLGDEDSRLASNLDKQKDKIQTHLDAFKKSAMKEYSNYILPNNVEAMNQAMQDFAQELNQIINESMKEFRDIAAQYPKATVEDDYFMKEEFGKVLEGKILNRMNARVDSIVKAADDRAEAAAKAAKEAAKQPAAKEPPKPEPGSNAEFMEQFKDDTVHRKMGKSPTEGDVLAGPQDIK